MGFYNSIYEILRQVPSGKVTTYGTLARMAGAPRSARQVGWALHCNSEPGVIPCHRVVNREGFLSGGFAFGGLEAQRCMLEAEGVEVDSNGRVDLSKYLWPAGK